MERLILKDKDFFEIIKTLIFSVMGLSFFFFPLIINNEVTSPVFFLSDFIYLHHQNFVYTCTLIFIILFLIKEVSKDKKSIFERISILLKVLSIIILIVLVLKNDIIFIQNRDLEQIMKDNFFKIMVLFPISCLFIPLLLEYGFIYILDGYFSRFTKKFFRITGKSVLIFFIFLFVDSFVGIYTVYKMYKDGKIRKNECANILLNYPILQMSIIIYVANQLNLSITVLLITSVSIFLITNFIICRIYPLKNIKKTFLVKNKYKEKNYKKNKLKMSLITYLENKNKKHLLKYVVEYFNEAINIVADIIPFFVLSFWCLDFICRSDLILSILAYPYEFFLELLKIPCSINISKTVILAFFNQVYSIEILTQNINLISRMIIALIVITQGISITTNIIFIRRYMRFITYRDIFVVYLEKIIITTFIIFFIYYLNLGYTIGYLGIFIVAQL